MKRSNIGLVASAALLVLMFQNCAQKVDFSTEGATAVGSAGGDGSGSGDDNSIPGPGETNEQFKVAFNREAAPLDMIWVIDNSASMNAEAALVRSNFDAFLTALNKSTNFRLLLITTSDPLRNGVSIPSNFDPATHKQIDYEVGSFNGPSVLLKKLNEVPSGFLRSDSKKIIVFVTDDNSKMTADNFMTSLISNQGWSQQDVSISSFIGIDAASSPCMAAEGVVYKDLASRSSGQTYNICNTDWSAHFSNLLNTSVSKAVRRFTLTKTSAVSSIVAIKVDGAELSSSQYSLSGKTVTLADSVNLTENSLVSITYK